MKLIILDANALIHRAYHALPPLSSAAGEPTGAIYGFFSSFIRMVNDLKPDYLVAAFDTPEPTFRHKEFEAYKAHRPKTPPDLAVQLGHTRDILKDIGVLTLEKDGYEADDIIGTIVFRLNPKSKAQNPKLRDLETIIVTGDLDTLQLVQDGVKVYTMRKGVTDIVIYDEKAVRERFGLAPSQLPDYKGFVGDASDNIPGVSGIGPKTAAKLLQTHGTLEKIFAANDTPEKLKQRKNEAFFSKALATINLNVPIAFDLEKAMWRGFNLSRVEALFMSLGFQSLLRRLQFQAQKPQTSLF